MTQNSPVKSAGSNLATWLNVAVVPIKQHVLCCGIVKPLVMAGALGAGAAELVESVPGEIASIVVLAPLITYGVMRSEAWWHGRSHAHGSEQHCAHPPLTPRRYFRETAISMGLCALTSLGMHALFPHEHEQGHSHNKIQPQTSLILTKHMEIS